MLSLHITKSHMKDKENYVLRLEGPIMHRSTFYVSRNIQPFQNTNSKNLPLAFSFLDYFESAKSLNLIRELFP